MSSSWHNITIEEIFDLRTRQRYFAVDFIESLKAVPHEERRLRIELEKVRDSPEGYIITCYMCGHPTMLRGSGFVPGTRQHKRLHFTHARPNANCEYQTPGIKSKVEINRIKYHGLREGREHIDLKEKFAKCLSIQGRNDGSISDVFVERTVKRIDENTWRKPDINFRFYGTHVAMELQLSTTYLDVINERHRFYRGLGTYMLWIFNHLSLDDQDREFAKNDVIFNNNENAYVFNLLESAKSIEEERLYLTCHFLIYRYNRRSKEIEAVWESELITLDDLTFDEATGIVYYFDSRKTRQEAKEARIKHFAEIEEVKRKKENLSQAISYHAKAIEKLEEKRRECVQKIQSKRLAAIALLERYKALTEDVLLNNTASEAIHASNATPMLRLIEIDADFDQIGRKRDAIANSAHLDKQIERLEESIQVLLNRRKHFFEMPASVKVNDFELMDVRDRFPEEVFFAYRDKLWGRHRFCPMATRFGNDLTALRYALENPDGNSFIYMERKDAVAIVDKMIQSQSEQAEGFKGEQRRTSQEFLAFVMTRHKGQIDDIRQQIFRLGLERRELGRLAKQTETDIGYTNEKLNEAKTELIQLSD